VRKFDAFATKWRRMKKKDERIKFKEYEKREMVERIMKLEEDEVAEFQRSDMEGEEEEEEVEEQGEEGEGEGEEKGKEKPSSPGREKRKMPRPRGSRSRSL